MENLKNEIDLLRECARKTDALNHRLVRCIMVLGIAWALAVTIVALIAFSYAFSTPYPQQVQRSVDGAMQQQGGVLE